MPETPQPEEISAVAEENSAPSDEITEIEIVDKAMKDEVVPMIEPHAPHETVHTWKDAFIHIGIITVGLLLAIGLEQTVEFFHHRHQLNEVRHQLSNEHELNKFQFQQNNRMMEMYITEYKSDLQVIAFLKAHPGAPPAQWPAKFEVFQFLDIYDFDAWTNFKASTLFDLMPYTEQRKWLTEFLWLSKCNNSSAELNEASKKLAALSIKQSELSKMTPAELDATADVITQILVTYKSILWTSSILNNTSNNEYTLPAELREFMKNDGDFKVKPDMQKFFDMETGEFLKARSALE
jgi:hypothetical protein